MIKHFEGRVALVTGGASGIGRATALAFATRGAKVVIADVDVRGGEETRKMINEAVDTFGRLDYAHNNAGIEDALTFTANCTEENWDRVINTNLKGVWLCMKYEIHQMLSQGRGAIVNTSSVAGLIGIPGWPAYSASKAGIIQLSRTAAVEYAKNGIRINAVCPGEVNTPLSDRARARTPRQGISDLVLNPLGRRAQPKEIAAAVVWLCSNSASFVTGHAMIVDGGMTQSSCYANSKRPLS